MIQDGTGVYAVENVLRPWAYVGATKSGFRQRWHAHLSSMHGSFHQNKGLRHDARYYGTCAFRFVVLQELPIFVDYAPFEQFWIDYLTRMGIRCYNQLPAWKTVPRELNAELLSAYPYTVIQLQDLAHVSARVIYRCIRAGIIEAIGDGKQWRISEASFKSFPLYWRQHRTFVISQRHLKVREGRLRRWASYKNDLC
jgi:hypothetical protein